MSMAEAIAEHIGEDRVKKLISQVMFGFSKINTKPANQTIVPTIFSTHDYNRRND